MTMHVRIVSVLAVGFGLSAASSGLNAAETAAQPPTAAAASAPLPPERPKPAEPTAEQTEPAKVLFSHKELPSIGKAAAIGYYPRGCLQGGVALPVTGATWQVMRLSRN